MAPQEFQIIGSSLDLFLMFAIGLLAFFPPKKFLGVKRTEEEKQKKIRILKICGVIIFLCAIGKLLLRIS
jgi:hypothetical protein